MGINNQGNFKETLDLPKSTDGTTLQRHFRFSD
jgi:hypothetical protein